MALIERRDTNGMQQSEAGPSVSNTDPASLICDLCKLVLPNMSTMKQHLLGQRHRKSDSVDAERKRVEQKCGLFIRGYHPNTPPDMLLNYFSQYGKIIWVHFGHSFLLLDYTEPAAAKTVIDKAHNLAGRHLMIKYRELKRQVRFHKPEENLCDFLYRLKEVSTLYEQSQILALNIQPNRRMEDINNSIICDDIYRALVNIFPRVHAYPFGSTQTGLGFMNSDVDIYISGVREGERDVEYLYKIKRLLMNTQKFANLYVIPQAKIPILKCVHVLTAHNCDINVRNMLGVCNSNLINAYLDMHPNLRSLMVVIKYWAKVHYITGQNHLFSNYALSLMFIFFLQQDPYNIPSVLTLQKNPVFAFYQEGWNGGFTPILTNGTFFSKIPMLELLERFFTFYIEFDYSINVICPYLGRTVKKEDFKNYKSLPSCFYQYQIYVKRGIQLKYEAAICIQDPFEHTRSAAPTVSGVTLETFVNFCRLGKKLCNGPENLLLYKLLTEVPPNVRSEIILKSIFSQFSIPMRPGLRYIESIEETSERPKAWFDSVEKFTMTVLKGFLKLNVVERSESPSSNKSKRNESQSDVYDKEQANRASYKCTGKLNLWGMRKSMAKNNKNEASGSIIEQEIAITKQLCNLYKNFAQDDDIIDFEITLEHYLDPPEVVFKVKRVAAYKNTFRSFAGFLSANLPAWFKIYEKEQNELCSKDQIG